MKNYALYAVDMTKEEISALVGELAADEIFRDGEEFDDVEWEVT